MFRALSDGSVFTLAHDLKDFDIDQIIGGMEDCEAIEKIGLTEDEVDEIHSAFSGASEYDSWMVVEGGVRFFATDKDRDTWESQI